ncbi:hypothetical protein Ddc_07682 [Ditylenchus destructor]|nr:hypothetical protein Ddc_07682 [Ditylenchus destructor]
MPSPFFSSHLLGRASKAWNAAGGNTALLVPHPLAFVREAHSKNGLAIAATLDCRPCSFLCFIVCVSAVAELGVE